MSGESICDILLNIIILTCTCVYIYIREKTNTKFKVVEQRKGMEEQMQGICLPLSTHPLCRPKPSDGKM